MSIKDSAFAAMELGFSAIPIKGDKKPAYAWSGQQSAIMETSTAEVVFGIVDQMAIVGGAVSGNLLVLDFDCCGKAFDAFFKKFCDAVDGPKSVERTPSGGYHVFIRCEEAIDGNSKLAMQRHYVDDITPELYGKTYKAKIDEDGRMYVDLPLIETRGEGGYVVCAPSAGYEWIIGGLHCVPVLTSEQMAATIEIAKSFHDVPESKARLASFAFDVDESGIKPGDDWNRRGDMSAFLQSQGWTLLRRVGDNEQWCRPGKTDGVSATWNGDVFYLFSSSCGFEENRGYSAFNAYAEIAHNGDHNEAAKALAADGYGSSVDEEAVAIGAALVAGLQKKMRKQIADDIKAGQPNNPGEFPVALLDVPGICAEFQQYIQDRSHKNQPILALAGSLTLLATLCSGKVRSEIGGHPCLYHIAVADTGAGKNAALEAIGEILLGIDEEGMAGPGEFASSPGMLRYVQRNPKCLFPIDEYGKVLSSMTNPRANEYLKEIGTCWMKMHSNPCTDYKSRAYANGDVITVKDSCINIYGATAPVHLFKSLTDDALDDGFISRHLIFFAPDGRAPSLIPSVFEPTENVLAAAKQWTWGLKSHDMRVLKYDKAALEAYRSYIEQCDNACDAEKKAGRLSLAALWTRAAQKADRLALVHAASRGPNVQRIELADWEWAEALVTYLTRKMIFELFSRIANGDYDRLRNAIIAVSTGCGKDGCSKTVLARDKRTSKYKPAQRKEAVLDLLDAGIIEMIDGSVNWKMTT